MEKSHSSDRKALTFAERLHYGLGTLGYNASFYWVSAFLQIYYTDTIGVSAGTLSALVLAVRLFDAINDPIIGSIADRTHSRWGRYRPWLMFAGLCLPLSVIALFGANSEWSSTGKVVWMCIWYVVVTAFATCYDMPYSALHGTLSPDSGERVRISSVRMACSQVGTQLTGILGVPLIIYFSHAGGQRTGHGYLVSVALVCLLAIPFAIWPAFKSRERVKPLASQKQIPLSGQMRTLFKNPPILVLTFAMFAFGFIGYGRGSMMIYYCTYVIGNPKAMSLHSFVNMAGVLVGTVYLMPTIYKYVRNKGYIAVCGHLLCGVASILIFFSAPGGIVFWLLMFLAAVGLGTLSSAQYSMLGDAVDYGEWKVGLRCDGFLSSFTSFALKAGGAISPALGLFMLNAAHYIPNTVQTPGVLSTMKITISIIPGVFALISALLIWLFYRLPDKIHKEIQKELQARRELEN